MTQPIPPSTDEFQAHLDDRLDAEGAAKVERWLDGHPDERARFEQHRRVGWALHANYDPIFDEAVPARLHSMVRIFPRRQIARTAMWTAIGLATGLVAGWLLGHWGSDAPRADADRPLVMRAAIVHATYSPEVRHPVEVGADQEAHLSAWLSKRLGHAIRPPKFEEQGFSLVGGRLLPGERTLSVSTEELPPPTAHFMYQCNSGRRVTLYVRPEAPQHHETALRFVRQSNMNIIYWSDRELGYALSSIDVGREELQRIADSAYRQLNP